VLQHLFRVYRHARSDYAAETGAILLTGRLSLYREMRSAGLSIPWPKNRRMSEASTRNGSGDGQQRAGGGGPVRIKANVLFIIPPRCCPHGQRRRWQEREGENRGKKNMGRAEVMRETAEYAIGIFHGSIMAIQSGGAAGATTEFVVSTWRRARRRCGLSAREGRGGRIGRGRVPASAATSSRMRFPSQRDPVGVFFPFPGNRMEKGA